jgi:hypothetical protein
VEAGTDVWPTSHRKARWSWWRLAPPVGARPYLPVTLLNPGRQKHNRTGEKNRATWLNEGVKVAARIMI